MNRTFTVDFNCTPTELADEFWGMYPYEQLATLHAMYTRFFRRPEDGKMQLEEIARVLNANPNKEYKEEIKHFVMRLYEYLCKEDKQYGTV